EGPLREQLTRQIKDAQLDGRVQLPGRTDQPWQALADADIFVLTSKVEGFPNALLEAMALGCACVTVDCPSGPRDMTQDGKYANLVPVDDIPALTQGIEQLIADRHLRESMGREAAVFVRERYGLEEVLEDWDALIHRVGKYRQGLS